MPVEEASSPAGSLARESAPASVDTLVDRLLAAYGGKRFIRGVHAISLVAHGEIRNPWQSRSAAVAYPIPNTYRFSFDWRGDRKAVDTDFVFPGGHRLKTRELHTPLQQVLLDMTTRNFLSTSDFVRLPAAERFHPFFTLRRLADDSAPKRIEGTVRVAGRAYETITTTSAAGTPLTLLVDTNAARIAGVQYRQWLADEERALATLMFVYGTDEAGTYPVAAEGSVGRELSLTWSYRFASMKLNPRFDDAQFRVPADFVAGGAAFPPTGSIEKLGAGIHLVRRLQNDDYNALVLEFDTYLAVIEAPLDRAAGEELRRIVDKIAPDKKIRYLVLSHHHADHIGGSAALIDEGTQVIAPAAAKPYVQAVLSQRRDLPAHGFSGLRAGEVFELGDGALKARVLATGENPHVEDLLFVHLPDDKLVFQADMFFFQKPERYSYPLNERGFAFFHALMLMGIDVQRIAGTHGATADREDLEKMLGNRVVSDAPSGGFAKGNVSMTNLRN